MCAERCDDRCPLDAARWRQECNSGTVLAAGPWPALVRAEGRGEPARAHVCGLVFYRIGRVNPKRFVFLHRRRYGISIQLDPGPDPKHLRYFYRIRVFACPSPSRVRVAELDALRHPCAHCPLCLLCARQAAPVPGCARRGPRAMNATHTQACQRSPYRARHARFDNVLREATTVTGCRSRSLILVGLVLLVVLPGIGRRTHTDASAVDRVGHCATARFDRSIV